MSRQGELVNVGLRDASDREIIRWMADLNQITPSQAAGEFKYETNGNISGFLFEKSFTKQPLKSGDVEPWAKRRGLGTRWPSFEDKNLTELVTAILGPTLARRNPRNTQLARGLPEKALRQGYSDGIHDHVRILTEKGRATYIGFTTAPYIRLDAQTLLDLADSLRGMGLVVRMGRAVDDWYGVNSFPVVVWNPNRIHLPETYAALNP